MKKILYSPREINGSIEDGFTVLIDIRDPVDYVADHIKGAINIPEVFEYLSTSDPEGLRDLRQTFQNLFARAGVTADKKVIFYEESMDSRYGASCRGYWLLTYLGHPDVGILDGGFLAWREENLPFDNHLVTPPESNFIVNPQAGLLATKNEVFAALGNSSVILLDCRDQEEWFGLSSSPYGVDYAPRKGRIPGAIWLEWYLLMERSQKIPGFKSKKEILAICAKLSITPDSDIIIYCFKGARAAHTYIALKLAGFNRLRIYFASWNEWARDFSLPIDK